MSTGNQSYNLASTTGNLFLDIGANGVLEIRDGSLTGTLLANVSTSDGFTYSVAGQGPDSSVSDSNSHSTTSQTLTFVDPSPSNSAVLNVGATYGQQSVAGVTNHFVDLGALSGATITVSSLFSNLTTADWIWIQGNGNDTVIGGGTKALEIVSYAVASATNQLTTSTSGNTTFIKDGTVTDFTVVNTSGTYTVTNGSGASLATASNVNDLHFFADNGTSAPTNFVDLQVGATYGSITSGSTPQGGHNYWIDGQSSGSDTISVSSLFPSLTADDNVFIQNLGGNDTITNTTPGIVAVGFSVATAASQLTQTSVSGTIAVMDGTTTDFTVTQSSGTYTVKSGSGATLGTLSGVNDLHFEVSAPGSTAAPTNILDLQVGDVYGGGATTTPQGGKFYFVNGSLFSDSVNITSSLFQSALTADDNVFIQNNGGNDTITNTTPAIVTASFNVASATNQLTYSNTSGTLAILDGTTTDFTVTQSSGTYTVKNAGGTTLATASGVNDLHFQVSAAGSTAAPTNIVDLQVGSVYGGGASSDPQGGKFYWVNGSLFSDTINITSSLFQSALTADDNVFIQNSGGNDTITNNTAAIVAVGFNVASAANQLTYSNTSGTLAVLDGTTTDFTVTQSSGTYTVKNASGATLATASGVNDLHFEVSAAGSTAAPTNFVDLQVGSVYGGGASTDPQGGKFYFVNGSLFSDSININSSLFQKVLSADDNVFIQNNGGNDTIANTTAAIVAVGFNVGSAANQLTYSNTSGTLAVLDGTTTDFTVTGTSGTYTVKNASGTTLATASGVNDLHFQVSAAGSTAAPTNFVDLQVGSVYGGGASSDPQGGKFYFVNGSLFSDTINITSSLFKSALTAQDNVFIQNSGGNDTITNNTAAIVAVAFNVGSAANQLTQTASGNTIAIKDGTATDFTIVNASGTYTVTNASGATLATASGINDLHFQVSAAGSTAAPTNFLDVQVGVTYGGGGTSTTPQGGKFYFVNGASFADTINVSSLFSSLTAQDNIFIQNNGGNDTITNTSAAIVTTGFLVASAASQLTTSSSGGTTAILDGTTTDFTVTSTSGTYTVKNGSGTVLATASGVNDLHFEVSTAGSTAAPTNFVDLQTGVTYGGGGTSTTPQGGKFYFVNGASFADTINVSSLFSALTAQDNIFIQNNGGNDTITNTSAAIVTTGFLVASAASQLTMSTSGGTTAILDGTTTDFTVTSSSGTYTVKNGSGTVLATASGVNDLHFEVSTAGSTAAPTNFVDLQTGVTYGGGGTSTTPQGGKFYFVNGSNFADTINVSALFSALTLNDNIFIQNNGGNDTITNTSAAIVTTGFMVASAANQLTTSSSGGTTAILDGTTTDFTVTASSGTYTVKNGSGTVLATASGVNDLHFEVSTASSTAAPTNFADLQVGLTYGEIGTGASAQGGHFFYVNGSSFADTVTIASLFPKAAATDVVFVENMGGNDTITNSTSAQVTAGFMVASAVNPLTEVNTSGTVAILDGTTTDFTVTQSSGTYTVKSGSGTTLATASGVGDLHFEVTPSGSAAPSNFVDLVTAVTKSGSNHSFFINGTSFNDTINVSTLYPSLTSADFVFIQNNGGNDTITGSSTAVVKVGFSVASVTTPSLVSTSGSLLVMDGTATDFVVTGTSGTYTVTTGSGTKLATASGVDTLCFFAGPASQPFTTINTIDTPLAAQSGNGGTIVLTPFNETVSAATFFASAGASDIVAFAAFGGNDTLTGHASGPNWYEFYSSVASSGTVNALPGTGTSGVFLAGTDTVTNFVSGTDVIAVGAGATAALSGNTVTFGGNLSGSLTATGATIAATDIFTLLEGKPAGFDFVSAQGVSQVLSGDGGTILLAQNNPGTTEILVNAGGNDQMIASQGPDTFVYTSVAATEKHTITNFSEANGDVIVVTAGTTVSLSTSTSGTTVTLSGSAGLTGSITVAGAIIDSAAIATLITGLTAGGDTVTTTGVTAAGTGGFVLQSANGTGTTTTLIGGANETLVHGPGAAGATTFDFTTAAAAAGISDTVWNFSSTKGDLIHLATGETFTHATSGANEALTVTTASGVFTVTIIGFTDSQFSSNWVKIG